MANTLNSKKIKGYLFNLIIYTDIDERAALFHTIVHDFISTFPCRVIFLKGNSNKKTDCLETKCLNDNCDQITIEVANNCIPIVPSIVLPHLIPDLPIYLIWGPNPTVENELLKTLQKFSTRFIFDSECEDNIQTFAKEMIKKIDCLKIDYMDVGWAQISGWRDVIAKTFNSKNKLKFLRKTKKISIKYNSLESDGERRTAREAIYLQCWLSSVFDWKNDLNFQLIPKVRSNFRTGRIFEIQFETFDNCSIILSLAEKQSKVLYYFSSTEKCELPLSIPISDIQKGINAMKEIFYFKTSSHYKKMLKKIGEVNWKE